MILVFELDAPYCIYSGDDDVGEKSVGHGLVRLQIVRPRNPLTRRLIEFVVKAQTSFRKLDLRGASQPPVELISTRKEETEGKTDTHSIKKKEVLRNEAYTERERKRESLAVCALELFSGRRKKDTHIGTSTRSSSFFCVTKLSICLAVQRVCRKIRGRHTDKARGKRSLLPERDSL